LGAGEYEKSYLGIYFCRSILDSVWGLYLALGSEFGVCDVESFPMGFFLDLDYLAFYFWSAESWIGLDGF